MDSTFRSCSKIVRTLLPLLALFAAGCPGGDDPVCGDGVAEEGEQCDDGNTAANDGCSPTCQTETPAVCGDGTVSGTEQCDDGNTTAGDGCDATCHDEADPVCGDGTIGGDEECDDGNTADGDGCDATCHDEAEPACGDGVLQRGEACDDGNTADGDGCSATCQTETPAVCGDGEVTVIPATSLRLQYRVEACSGAPTLTFDINGHQVQSVVSPNGCNCEGPVGETVITDPAIIGSLSPDGNNVTIISETQEQYLGWVTLTMINGNESQEIVIFDAQDGGDALAHTTDICNAGFVEPPFTVTVPIGAGIGEICDDGNSVEGDGCDSNCTVSACGNGVQSPDEACDDGNTANGDGCNALCAVPACGDGIVDSNESCDDGNTLPDDGCNAACDWEFCGDGVVQPNLGESCDDGNQNDNDGCSSWCSLELCGNGTVDEGEVCDDGNHTAGDGCRADCFGTEVCGDGWLDDAAGEQCDDGNTDDTDACDNSCVGHESCNDFWENDGDGLTDCQDPDCATAEVCVGGTGGIGASCDLPNDCASSGQDPFCIPAEWGWPGGACSEFCSPQLNDCPSGSICLDADFGAPAGLCVTTCTSNQDCSAGLTCQDIGAAAMVCFPG
jgi:cysteine-rich repeat protein